jgi:hypothetical protein
MRIFLICLTDIIAACSCSENDRSQKHQKTSDSYIRKELFSLEKKWLEYEFALDTASLSPMLDESFISISATDTSNKQMELEGIYRSISAMRNDSIFIDSFKIEEPFIVNVYDNSAVTIFVCHTYKKDKGKPVEKRTKFYDVWINRNGKWKAVSSQGTAVNEI